MPVEMRMWRIDGDEPRRLQSATLPSEAALEDFLEKDPSLLGTPLLVIGRQVRTPYGKFIDLLAIDGDGNLHVLELKRDRTPRDVVAQVLDYGSWVSTLTRDEVIDIANNHLDVRFEAAFEETFGETAPDELNGDLQLTVVATDLDGSSERIVTYLRSFGVPVNAVFFSYLEDDDRQYLARSWLVADSRAGAQQAGRTGGKRAAWNGRDWYVAFGGSLGRTWDDALKFGFISAGGGPRYSGKLRTMPVDARVNVHIPVQGYVAVGVTLGPAKRFDEVEVMVDGQLVSLAEQPLEGSYRHAESPSDESDELAEWVIPVRWLAGGPLSEAFWEKGMFANQNPVCELRQEFTLERLAAHFGLDDDLG